MESRGGRGGGTGPPGGSGGAGGEVPGVRPLRTQQGRSLRNWPDDYLKMRKLEGPWFDPIHHHHGEQPCPSICGQGSDGHRHCGFFKDTGPFCSSGTSEF